MEAGAVQDGTVSLHLNDLRWPSPPPSPPVSPPPPPARFLNGSHDAEIECSFYAATDWTTTAANAGAPTRASAESERHCCGLCGMRDGCTDFVFMPDTGACLLMPRVDAGQAIRVPNPSTIAGSVYVSRGPPKDAPVHHAACTYELGRTYVRGELGHAHAIAGAPMASRQARARSHRRVARHATPLIRPPAALRTAATRANASASAPSLCGRSTRGAASSSERMLSRTSPKASSPAR